MKIVRDDMGNVTSMEGISVEMLNWMTRAYNLTYYKMAHRNLEIAFNPTFKI